MRCWVSSQWYGEMDLGEASGTDEIIDGLGEIEGTMVDARRRVIVSVALIAKERSCNGERWEGRPRELYEEG